MCRRLEDVTPKAPVAINAVVKEEAMQVDGARQEVHGAAATLTSLLTSAANNAHQQVPAAVVSNAAVNDVPMQVDNAPQQVHAANAAPVVEEAQQQVPVANAAPAVNGALQQWHGDEPLDHTQLYPVDKIVASRTVKGKPTEYSVRFTGYDATGDWWYTVSALREAVDSMDTFKVLMDEWKQCRKSRSISRPLTRPPCTTFKRIN